MDDTCNTYNTCNTCDTCDTPSPVDSQMITCCGSQSVITKSNTAVSQTASAADQKEGKITFSIGTPPGNGAAKVDFSTGVWSYLPNPDFVGRDTFTIKAANSDCSFCTITIEIEVQAQPPCCAPISPLTILSGSRTAGYVRASDPQNQIITYEVTAQPVNGSLELNSVTGKWVYTPDDDFKGEDNFSVRATNQSGLWCAKTQSITVASVCAALSKAASAETVCEGCTFKYIITAANTGTAVIEDGMIKDELPSCLKVMTLELNGKKVRGDLCAGIPTGCIRPGTETVLTVTVKVLSHAPACPYRNTAEGIFRATLNPWEPPAVIKKTAVDSVGITVQNPKLTIVKSVSQTLTAVDEVISYSLVVKNIGNVPLVNVTILDPLDAMLQFQEGSLKINEVVKPKAQIAAGVVLPPLKVQETASITFHARVLSKGGGAIENQAIGTFEYAGCTENTLTSGTAVSNIVKIEIVNPCLKLEKTVDKSLAVLSDTLTYTVTILNDGDVDALNIIFKDLLSPSVRLIEHSFEINGKAAGGGNLLSGVYLGSLTPGNTITVRYMVLVVSMNGGGIITNEASAEFSYCAGACSPVKRRQSKTANTKICQAISLFKQLNVKCNLSLRASKPDMEQINSVTGTVDTIDFYIIETPVSTSSEGQNLTGYKLIFHGILNLEVEYTADDKEQTVYSEHYSEPFSSFVVLQPDFNSDTLSVVRAVVEHIYFKQTSNRCFYTNAAMLVMVNAK